MMSTLFGPERRQPLTVAVSEHAGVLVARVSGDVDQSTAPLLRRHLHPLWGCSGVRALVLDMGEVSFIDSTGVGELIAVLRRCEELAMALALSGVHGIVARVLTITGLTRAFDIHPTTENALQAWVADADTA
ncbi:STAS domain-containing protein [Planobispora takensis]|nr:STAS domain-containing protein [Planobispora takensis]